MPDRLETPDLALAPEYRPATVADADPHPNSTALYQVDAEETSGTEVRYERLALS